MSYGYGDPLAMQADSNQLFECQNCRRKTVRRTEDGSYICSACGTIADIHQTFDDIDNFTGQESVVRSFHISSQSEFDNTRVHEVIIAEALQLMLACQTVYAEKILSIDLSSSVFLYMQRFSSLIRPPVNSRTFSYIPLILLSGILHLGLPCTHMDIIRWIIQGKLPFTNPQTYFPISFFSRLSQAEITLLSPTLINLRKLIWGDGENRFSHRIHPLPNPSLVFWRISSILRLPPRPFSELCLSFAHDPQFLSIPSFATAFSTQNDRDRLFKISSFMRIAYGIPSAIALFALVLIYRLDGTDWIHPEFAALGFPPLSIIMSTTLAPTEVLPAFPKVSGDIPNIHSDLSKLLEESDHIPVVITPIIDSVREGYGNDSLAVFDINSLAEMNNDLRTLLNGISRALGISPLIIAQHFIQICKLRYGNSAVKKRVKIAPH